MISLSVTYLKVLQVYQRNVASYLKQTMTIHVCVESKEKKTLLSNIKTKY